MGLTTCKPRDGSCELSRDPARPGSPFCYWHRLSYCASSAQVAEAAHRREADAQPVQHGGPRAVTCKHCRAAVPPFYMKNGTSCRGCSSLDARTARVKRVYGLEEGGYEALLASQRGACAICRARPTGRRRLVVDHNHKTGVVRGLLCDRCNHDLLGAAHDGPILLMRALLYLLGADVANIGSGAAELTSTLTVTMNQRMM